MKNENMVIISVIDYKNHLDTISKLRKENKDLKKGKGFFCIYKKDLGADSVKIFSKEKKMRDFLKDYIKSVNDLQKSVEIKEWEQREDEMDKIIDTLSSSFWERLKYLFNNKMWEVVK